MIKNLGWLIENPGEVPIAVRTAILRKALKKIKRVGPKMSKVERGKTFEALVELFCAKDDDDVPKILAAVQKEYFEALRSIISKDTMSGLCRVDTYEIWR